MENDSADSLWEGDISVSGGGLAVVMVLEQVNIADVAQD